MKKNERKRFDRLREDVEKEVGDCFLEKLTYPDFLLMLRKDPELQALIRAIAGAPEARRELSPSLEHDADQSEEEATEAEEARPQLTCQSQSEACSDPDSEDTDPDPHAATPAHAAPAGDALSQALQPERRLLAMVRADAELAADWLGDVDEDEGRQLVRLIARASQWDAILDVWDRLATDCKGAQRAARPEQLELLSACLKVHNLIWHSRQAGLVHAQIGATYDHRQHQRGTHSGERIQAEWLPGLMNAGGSLQKQPLVATA
jgi:hypothetical protein